MALTDILLIVVALELGIIINGVGMGLNKINSISTQQNKFFKDILDEVKEIK